MWWWQCGLLLSFERMRCWVCSYKTLPFEAHPACWNAIPEANARSLIQSLLKPKPQERATATSVLASPLLAEMELLSTE